MAMLMLPVAGSRTEAVTPYSPGATPGMTKVPSAFTMAAITCPSEGLTIATEMFACGRPSALVTVPDTLATRPSGCTMLTPGRSCATPTVTRWASEGLSAPG